MCSYCQLITSIYLIHLIKHKIPAAVRNQGLHQVGASSTAWRILRL